MEQKYLELIKRKKRFIALVLSVSFVFYFMLPLSLIFFPKVMTQTSFIPGVSWSWLFAFLQILMTWFMVHLYHRKAKYFDKVAEEIKRERLL